MIIILKCIMRVTDMHTWVMIHFSCSEQHSSTSFPKLALVIRSLSTHQFLFFSFLPPTNSGSLPLFKVQYGIFQLLNTFSSSGGVLYSNTHTTLSLPFCLTGIIVHQQLLLCEDRLALTVRTALDML